MKTAILAAMLLLAAPAQAAPTLISPAPGQSTSGHPMFTWALGPTEEFSSLYVATQPTMTPDGRFFSENVTDLETTGADNVYQPSSAYNAGTYWWTVRSTVNEPEYTTLWAAPQSFVVPVRVSIRSLRITRYTNIHELAVGVEFAKNTEPEAIVTFQVFNKRRLLFQKRERAYSSAFMNWAPRRRPAVRTVRVVVTVTSQGTSAVKSRLVRTP